MHRCCVERGWVPLCRRAVPLQRIVMPQHRAALRPTQRNDLCEGTERHVIACMIKRHNDAHAVDMEDGMGMAHSPGGNGIVSRAD